MLSCYRVLDLTNEKGFMCGKALGDLGADVIKIEKPGGDPARRIGPFYHDIPDPEKSLYWFAFNANKRSITLDIEKADGQQIFKSLAKTADVVIESFDPGYMDKLGLGYETLSELNPKLILTSVSGFGQEGPYRDYKAPDIVLWALSGMMYMVGDPDRPPLAPSYPHVYLFAGALGALGTMIALYHRKRIGRGQHVDAPVLMYLTYPTTPDVQGLWDFSRIILRRMGRMLLRTGTGIAVPVIWECKDGDVSYRLFLGHGQAKANAALIEWMEGDGIHCDILSQVDWETLDWEKIGKDFADEFVAKFDRFARKHTKAELFEGALERGIQLFPLYTPRDILKSTQLSKRDYWVRVEHPHLGATLTYPGAFIKLSETPWKIRRCAPLVGEHNEEIYGKELGLSSQQLITLKQINVI